MMSNLTDLDDFDGLQLEDLDKDFYGSESEDDPVQDLDDHYLDDFEMWPEGVNNV